MRASSASARGDERGGGRRRSGAPAAPPSAAGSDPSGGSWRRLRASGWGEEREAAGLGYLRGGCCCLGEGATAAASCPTRTWAAAAGVLGRETGRWAARGAGPSAGLRPSRRARDFF